MASKAAKPKPGGKSRLVAHGRVFAAKKGKKDNVEDRINEEDMD